MARVWAPQPNTVLKQWLEAILKESHRLSDWEQTFISNVAIRIMNGANISQTQEETLEKIYAEKTS